MSFQSLFHSTKKRQSSQSDKGETVEKEKTPKPSNPRHDTTFTTNDNTSMARAQTVKLSHATSRESREFHQNKSSDRKRKRGPVSQGALALSARLKELSRQKRLEQVLQLYWNAKDRDAHHACMVIDCCARCGNVADAERVFKQAMSGTDSSSNVEVHTALLKAYAHAGRMDKADELYTRMCKSQSRVIPNVRTLNTLLRGCLWTAASLHEDGVVVGGVVTSERAWKLYNERVGAKTLDESSYEYSITLLCQALRVHDAMDRIEEFKERHSIKLKGKASFRGGDQTTLETLAIAYLAMAKAYGMLGRWDDTWTACQRVLNAVDGSRAQLVSGSASTTRVSEAVSRHQHTTGGKKSWNRAVESQSQRQASNTSFRSHRLSELETEARNMLKARSDKKLNSSKISISERLLTGLLCFSGGGTTELATKKEERCPSTNRIDHLQSLLVPAWYSFGLAVLMNGSIEASQQKKNEPDPEKVYRALGHDKIMTKIINREGRINIDCLFPDGKRPIDLELGCGFGEWIAQHAQNNQTRNYIAVELRADRVAQIFVKSALLRRLRNVCVVAADSARFLQSHVAPSTFSNVFVNHPEPPTQTLGDNTSDLDGIMAGGTEPAHMLNSAAMQAIAYALLPGGKLSIISDNRWYSRLLCATIAKANYSSTVKLISPSPREADDMGLQELESFENGAILYRSISRSNASHTGEGLTWFDRLWQTGTGKHAERTTRYAVIVTKQTV
jgi:pentatricopeptide repeat protein